MAKIFFSDIKSVTLNYHTPRHNLYVETIRFSNYICLGVWLFRVTDCMSEKNILADPGGSNSAFFESETHDP